MVFNIDESKDVFIEGLGVTKEEYRNLRKSLLAATVGAFGENGEGFNFVVWVKNAQERGLLDSRRNAFLVGFMIGASIFNLNELVGVGDE